jgi:hypothetical protein
VANKKDGAKLVGEAFDAADLRAIDWPLVRSGSTFGTR